MRRVVLDTNVLVSAILIPKGIPAKILNLVRQDKVALIFSHATLKELDRVLHYDRLVSLLKKKGLAVSTVETFVKDLVRIAIITPGTLEVAAIQADPADNLILACAVEGQADFIVSGDHHLTDLKSFQGIKIVAPRTFLKLIAS